MAQLLLRRHNALLRLHPLASIALPSSSPPPPPIQSPPEVTWRLWQAQLLYGSLALECSFDGSRSSFNSSGQKPKSNDSSSNRTFLRNILQEDIKFIEESGGQPADEESVIMASSSLQKTEEKGEVPETGKASGRSTVVVEMDTLCPVRSQVSKSSSSKEDEKTIETRKSISPGPVSQNLNSPSNVSASSSITNTSQWVRLLSIRGDSDKGEVSSADVAPGYRFSQNMGFMKGKLSENVSMTGQGLHQETEIIKAASNKSDLTKKVPETGNASGRSTVVAELEMDPLSLVRSQLRESSSSKEDKKTIETTKSSSPGPVSQNVNIPPNVSASSSISNESTSDWTFLLSLKGDSDKGQEIPKVANNKSDLTKSGSTESATLSKQEFGKRNSAVFPSQVKPVKHSNSSIDDSREGNHDTFPFKSKPLHVQSESRTTAGSAADGGFTVCVKERPPIIELSKIVGLLSVYGNIVSSFRRMKSDGTSACFIKFKTGEAREKALAARCLYIDGTRLLITRVDQPMTSVVRITNASPETTKSKVLFVCESYGEVDELKRRGRCIFDVYFKSRELPHMLNILYSLNNVTLDRRKWTALSAPIVHPKEVEGLFKRRGGLPWYFAQQVVALNKMEEAIQNMMIDLQDIQGLIELMNEKNVL